MCIADNKKKRLSPAAYFTYELGLLNLILQVTVATAEYRNQKESL